MLTSDSEPKVYLDGKLVEAPTMINAFKETWWTVLWRTSGPLPRMNRLQTRTLYEA